MHRSATIATLAIFLAAASAAPAHADLRFTPFAGITFGGDAESQQLSMGAAFTAMGKAAGVEVEFGYTPDFFGEREGVALIADSNVTSLMGSLVVGPGEGAIRPYATAGLGLMRIRADTDDLLTDLSTNNWAASAGIGILFLVSDNLALRGDVRYFTRLEDPDDDNDLDVSFGRFTFWRATGGLSFRF
jgi:opacity protein-like surface antigen